MKALDAWLDLLSMVSTVILTVLLLVNLNDTERFAKTLGLLALMALWEIASEVRKIRTRKPTPIKVEYR